MADEILIDENPIPCCASCTCGQLHRSKPVTDPITEE
jgi:hypothetical protein